MTSCLSAERVCIPAADYQALNTLMSLYVTAYDDFHDGRLSKEKYKQIVEDAVTEDFRYQLQHRQQPGNHKRINGFEELWKNYGGKLFFPDGEDLFHVISPILVTDYGVNKSRGDTEATFRCRLIVTYRVRPKRKLMMLTEDVTITARNVNGKWKLCSLQNAVSSLKPGALRSAL